MRHQVAVAASTSQASRGAGAARALQLGVDLVEAGVEDVVVDADERVDAASAAVADADRGASAPSTQRWHAASTEHQRRARSTEHRGTAHVTLVRSCCFSACRSRASAISRSSRAG